MKAILEFDLSEEREEYETMMKGKDYSMALWDIQNLVKVFSDKFECFTDEKSIELFEEFKSAFWEAISDRHIEL